MTPIFFAAAEWAFVLAACARLIPSEGDGPGALEAHAPIFLYRDLAGDYGKGVDWFMDGPHDSNAAGALGFQSPLTPQAIYRQSIAAVDMTCAQAFGAPLREHLEREKIAHDELMSQMRLQGLEDLAEVKPSYIEADGRVSPRQATPQRRKPGRAKSAAAHVSGAATAPERGKGGSRTMKAPPCPARCRPLRRPESPPCRRPSPSRRCSAQPAQSKARAPTPRIWPTRGEVPLSGSAWRTRRPAFGVLRS